MTLHPISIHTFSYKTDPIPGNCATIFDARVIDNPHKIESLAPKTGLNPEVAEWLLARPSFLQAYKDIRREVDKVQSSDTISIAIGCYGGRHRSVALAEYLAKQLRGDGYSVNVQYNHV